MSVRLNILRRSLHGHSGSYMWLWEAENSSKRKPKERSEEISEWSSDNVWPRPWRLRPLSPTVASLPWKVSRTKYQQNHSAYGQPSSWCWSSLRNSSLPGHKPRFRSLHIHRLMCKESNARDLEPLGYAASLAFEAQLQIVRDSRGAGAWFIHDMICRQSSCIFRPCWGGLGISCMGTCTSDRCCLFSSSAPMSSEIKAWIAGFQRHGGGAHSVEQS